MRGGRIGRRVRYGLAFAIGVGLVTALAAPQPRWRRTGPVGVRRWYQGATADGRTIVTTPERAHRGWFSGIRRGAPLELRDAATGRVKTVVRTGRHAPLGMELSPDGSLAAIVTPRQGRWDDYRVPYDLVVRQVADGRTLAVLPLGPFVSATRCPVSLRFSPDGRLLIHECWSETRRDLMAWDVRTRRHRYRVAAGPEGVQGDILFSPDGRLFVAGAGYHAAGSVGPIARPALVETATGRVLFRVGPFGGVRAVFAPDSTLLAVTTTVMDRWGCDPDDEVDVTTMYRLPDGAPVATLPYCDGLDFTGDGAPVACYRKGDGRELWVMDAASWRPRRRIPMDGVGDSWHVWPLLPGNDRLAVWVTVPVTPDPWRKWFSTIVERKRSVSHKRQQVIRLIDTAKGSLGEVVFRMPRPGAEVFPLPGSTVLVSEREGRRKGEAALHRNRLELWDASPSRPWGTIAIVALGWGVLLGLVAWLRDRRRRR